MKLVKTFLTCSILLVCSFLYAQKTLPNSTISDLNGKKVSVQSFLEDDKPILLVFWATWCSHTVEGLTSISDDYYEDWQEETQVKIIAVSVDDARNQSKVKPFAEGRGWEFDIYMDPNGDFKRAMNVNNAPFFMILNSSGQVVWQQNSFMNGDEELIYEELVKLNTK